MRKGKNDPDKGFTALKYTFIAALIALGVLLGYGQRCYLHDMRVAATYTDTSAFKVSTYMLYSNDTDRGQQDKYLVNNNTN